MANAHKEGGELVVMLKLLDTDWPLSSTQLNVNTKDKGSWTWRAVGGRMKLIVCEASTLTELGESDEERAIAGLSTDHVARPVDLVINVPTTFNLTEGLILMTAPLNDESPPTTPTLTTGERSSTIVTSKVLSHSRSSSAEPAALPLEDTLKTWPRETLPRRKEEEFTLRMTCEEDPNENTSNSSQVERKVGNTREQSQEKESRLAQLSDSTLGE
jgi:hypothetical protein